MSDEPQEVAVPPDELHITIEPPITLGEVSYALLTLREPTAAQMLQWDKLEGTEADIVAVSIVGGVPRAVVEKLRARDLLKGSRYIGGFLA